MNTYALPKPKVRYCGQNGHHNYDVDFGMGRRPARIFRSSSGDRDWCYETPEQPSRTTWGEQEAFARAWMASIDAPPPIGLSREEVAKQIDAAEQGNSTAAAKLMRTWLKLRTGIQWSVTGGRGTARCWLRIHVPKARKVDSAGKPSTKSWGYMGARDRALLGVLLDELPHNQGESIRTEAGVRAWYLWKISGYGVPEDLNVAQPGWD